MASFNEVSYGYCMTNSDIYSLKYGLIRKQLETITSSEAFKKSRLLTVFLTFIVEETLAGRDDEIKEYTIGRNALGKPADFNPQFDAAVRIHAGRLRRLLSEYYSTVGAKDDVRIEIPKGSYIPVFSDLRSEAGSTPSTPNEQPADKKNHNKIFHRKVTIAVFPFKNQRQDHAKELFLHDLGEQISIDLSKFEHLSVISYYSMRQAAEEKKTIDGINKIYDIDYILTGSVRLSGRDIQVNVQLLHTDSSALVWTHSFLLHYTQADLDTIPNDMIEEIVNTIADVDGIIAKNVISPSLAHKREIFGVNYMVYQYYSYLGKYDKNSFSQACSVVEEATALDPSNAMICAFRAELYLKNYIFQIEPGADLQKTKKYAEQALRIDRNCQYAYKTLAWYSLLTGKKDECLNAIEKCLDLNSKAMSILSNIGFLLICLGRFSQGFQLLQKNKQLNFILAWYAGLGFALFYYQNENYFETLKWIQRSNIPSFPLRSLVINATKGKIKEQGRSSNVIGLHMEELQALEQMGEENILHEYIRDETLCTKLKKGLILERDNVN